MFHLQQQLFLLVLAFAFTFAPIIQASDERRDWYELPSELLSSASGYLSPREFLTKVRLVCSKWRNVQGRWPKFCNIKGHKLSRLLMATKARSLRSVHILDGTSLQDEELSCLSAQPELQDFEISSGWLLTDAAITNLPCLVERLKLKDCPKITGLTMQYLQNLKSVTLSDCDLGNEGLRGISGCPQLSSLHLFFLECTKVTNEGLRYLSTSRLHELELWNSIIITDEGLAHLGGLKYLQILSLGMLSRITDAGIAALPAATLSELSLNCMDKITGQMLPCLQGLTSLKIDRCKKLSDQGLENLAHLTTLYLHNVPSISESKLTGLCACSNLKSLFLSGEAVTDNVLAYVETLTNLQTLTLIDCSLITKNGVQQLINELDLKQLDICGCEKIGKKGLAELEEELNKKIKDRGIRKEPNAPSQGFIE